MKFVRALLITLLAIAPLSSTHAQSVYPNAVTDRLPRPVPTITVPAGLNVTFVEPSFGRVLKRLTDGTVGSNSSLNGSHRMPSSEQVAAIGHNSDRFYATTPHGTIEYFTLDKAKNATYVRDLPFTSEPTFSRVQPAVIFGAVGYKVIAYNTDTQVTTTLFDLTKADPTYAVAPLVLGGSVQSSASTPERLLVIYGGSSQDKHFRAAVFDTSGGAPQIVDTVAKTLNGNPIALDASFHLHAIGMDQSGRFAILYPTGPDQQVGAAQAYFWDLTSNTITGNRKYAYGHDAAGFGVYVNQDNGPCSPYDALQYQFRRLDDINNPSCVINPPLTPKMAAMADHPQWNNASPTTTNPFLTLTYRYYEDTPQNLETDPTHRTNTVAWRAGDNEVLSIDPVKGTIWRWTHHLADVYADDGSTIGASFWYQPIGQASPDGTFFIFDSNMMKTLGLDKQEPNPATKYRVDLFLVDTTLPLVTTTTPIVTPTAITRAQPFTVTVTTDGIDVTSVELFLNGASQGVKPFGTSTAVVYTFTQGLAPGAYTFGATATGPGGATDYDPVTLTVQPGKPHKGTLTIQ